MELYIIIGLLILTIILLIINIRKSNNNKDSRDLIERIGKIRYNFD